MEHIRSLTIFSVMGMGITYIHPVWMEFIVVGYLVDTVLSLVCQVCSLVGYRIVCFHSCIEELFLPNNSYLL